MECRLRLLQELKQRYVDTMELVHSLSSYLDLAEGRKIGQNLLEKIGSLKEKRKVQDIKPSPPARSPVTKCLIALQYFVEQTAVAIRKIVSNEECDTMVSDLIKIAVDFMRLCRRLPFPNKTRKRHEDVTNNKKTRTSGNGNDTSFNKGKSPASGSREHVNNNSTSSKKEGPKPKEEDTDTAAAREKEGVGEADEEEIALTRELENSRRQVMQAEAALWELENRAEDIYVRSANELYAPFGIPAPSSGLWDNKFTKEKTGMDNADQSKLDVGGDELKKKKDEGRPNDPLRLAAEAEFVQCLANPKFLREMVRYLPDIRFRQFLNYLKYWYDRRYALLLTYPLCLQTLELLVNPTCAMMLEEDPQSSIEVDASIVRQWARGQECEIRNPLLALPHAHDPHTQLPPGLMGAPLPVAVMNRSLDKLSGPPQPNETLSEAACISGQNFFRTAESRTDFSEFSHVYQSHPLNNECLWKFEELPPLTGSIRLYGIEAHTDPVLIDNRLPTPPRQRPPKQEEEKVEEEVEHHDKKAKCNAARPRKNVRSKKTTSTRELDDEVYQGPGTSGDTRAVAKNSVVAVAKNTPPPQGILHSHRGTVCAIPPGHTQGAGTPLPRELPYRGPPPPGAAGVSVAPHHLAGGVIGVPPRKQALNQAQGPLNHGNNNHHLSLNLPPSHASSSHTAAPHALVWPFGPSPPPTMAPHGQMPHQGSPYGAQPQHAAPHAAVLRHQSPHGVTAVRGVHGGEADARSIPVRNSRQENEKRPLSTLAPQDAAAASTTAAGAPGTLGASLTREPATGAPSASAPPVAKRVKKHAPLDGRWRSSLRKGLVVEVEDHVLVKFNGKPMPHEIRFDLGEKRYRWGDWRGEEEFIGSTRTIKWVNDSRVCVTWTQVS